MGDEFQRSQLEAMTITGQIKDPAGEISRLMVNFIPHFTARYRQSGWLNETIPITVYDRTTHEEQTLQRPVYQCHIGLMLIDKAIQNANPSQATGTRSAQQSFALLDNAYVAYKQLPLTNQRSDTARLYKEFMSSTNYRFLVQTFKTVSVTNPDAVPEYEAAAVGALVYALRNPLDQDTEGMVNLLLKNAGPITQDLAIYSLIAKAKQIQ